MWPVLHPGVITAVDAEAARQLYAHRPGVIVSNSRSREDVSDTRELGVSGDNPRGCTR
jgi:hypothetical protein